MEVMEKPESDFFIQLLAVKTQWGVVPSGNYAYTAATVNLPISFQNTNYAVVITPFGSVGSGDVAFRQFVCVNKNTNKFTAANNSSDSVSAIYLAAG